MSGLLDHNQFGNVLIRHVLPLVRTAAAFPVALISRFLLPLVLLHSSKLSHAKQSLRTALSPVLASTVRMLSEHLLCLVAAARSCNKTCPSRDDSAGPTLHRLKMRCYLVHLEHIVLRISLAQPSFCTAP